MAQAKAPAADLTLKQYRYADQIEAVCERLEGPVCQIGARAQVLDTKRKGWRQRLEGKGFIGADLEAGDNVDAVFDLCGRLETIQEALAPALAGRPLRGMVCAHLLEHLRKPWVAAENIAALLAPGGTVFIQVPWVQAFHGFPDDYWRMSLSGIAALFPDFELLDAFWSGGSSDIAYRVVRDGRPDPGVPLHQLEARFFQVLLAPEANQRFLKGLARGPAYLSRGYMPVMTVSYLGRKPGA